MAIMVYRFWAPVLELKLEGKDVPSFGDLMFMHSIDLLRIDTQSNLRGWPAKFADHDRLDWGCPSRRWDIEPNSDSIRWGGWDGIDPTDDCYADD